MHRRNRRSGILASAIVLTFLAGPGPAQAAPEPVPTPDAHPGSGTALGAPGVVDPADKITPAATKAFQARGSSPWW